MPSLLKKSLWRAGTHDSWKTYMPQRAKGLTVHNGATHNLGIGFDDEVQGKPTQSDSYELLVWRSQTTDLPFLAGEDFLDIHV